MGKIYWAEKLGFKAKDQFYLDQSPSVQCHTWDELFYSN